MKIICNRIELLEALMGVSKAVSAKSTIPALEGILLQFSGTIMTLTAYDLELSITTTISAEIEDPFDIVINAKLFIDMVRKMESESVTLQVGNDLRTVVRGGNSRFSMLSIQASDFPELSYPEEESRLSIPGNILKEMIDKTLYAVSNNNQKPVHTGTKFIIENDTLTLVSVDGFRLAMCKKEGLSFDTYMSFVVPARTLAEISHLTGDVEDKIEISMARRYAVFNLPGYKLMTRLLEGDFLDYTKSIPENNKTRIRIVVQPFFDSVERASLIITDRFKSPLRMRFENGCVNISCSTPQGNANEVVDCMIEGDDIEIGFNNKYIMDALRYSGCEELFLEMSTSITPVKILPVESTCDFLYLILPVRIKAGE